MKFRLARDSDLEAIYKMYHEIVHNMNEQGISIWNDYYPFECFRGDIQSERLFVLEEDNKIVSACSLCCINEAEKSMNWQNNHAKALYIDRLGVNVHEQRKGLGSLLINYAKTYGKENGFDYLRLFVVDGNNPAMKLYEKNGFNKLSGSYEEKISDAITLKEFAYELKIDE